MTRLRLLLFLGVAFILLLLGLSAGVWWYLFGANPVVAAELVPAETIAFAAIPNGATVLAGYQTSQLKTLIDSPNSKPMIDSIETLIGQKNIDLINAFLPNLSGQSFIAVTHFDPDKPEHVGLVAAMKPKPGLGDFDAFVAKLKTTWPDLLKQGTTGAGNVAGVGYQWIQGPGATDKVCVAQVGGWIVTAWGEASLQDWVERYQKKSSTPSLAQNADYQKSLTRVGPDPTTLVYVDYHAVMEIFQTQMAKGNPAAGAILKQKLGLIGAAAMATRFENGEIVDRLSMLLPRQAQIESGMSSTPCPFDTLKFTGPDTSFYWGFGIDWKQYYKNLQEHTGQAATVSPMANGLVTSVQTWAQGAGIDMQHNMIDALGSEFSIQEEWSGDTTYPEVGLFVKLDKPDDFKPTINAIIESVRKAYATTAVVHELNSNGHNFAALKFVQSSPISPTITEDGDYLGIFLTENQAVRSFQRDASIGLPHNADFARQIGDKRNGASQILFLDTPHLLDHAYRTALPFLSLASMFNRDLAAMLKGKDLPPDLSWLAPMGTWSFIMTPDDEGIQAYSVSGIGNQGIFLGASVGGATSAAQSMGLMPRFTAMPGMTSAPGTLAVPVAPIPSTPPSFSTNATSATPATIQVSAPVEPANDLTNAAAASGAAMTNSAPAGSPPTHATPDATQPTPEPAPTK